MFAVNYNHFAAYQWYAVATLAVILVLFAGLTRWILGPWRRSRQRAKYRLEHPNEAVPDDVGKSQPKSGILMGLDGRLSTSKTIAFSWFLVVSWLLLTLIYVALFAYESHPLTWFQGGVLSQLGGTYLGLLGGPFASLIGGGLIVGSKVANQSLQKPSGDGTVHPSDVVNDDSGHVDLVDFQYLIFNLIAAIFVIVMFADHPGLGFPAIPSQLVVLTLGPSAVYLVNKAAVTNPVTVTNVLPGTARVGQTVTITGNNFAPAGTDTPNAPGQAVSNPTVTVDDIVAEVKDGFSNSQLTITVPVDIPVGDLGEQLPVVVTTTVGATSQPGFPTLKVIQDKPVITGLSARSVSAGNLVSIFGQYFQPPSGSPDGAPPVVVSLNGQEVDATILGDNQINITVPSGIPAGPVDLAVVRNGYSAVDQLQVS